MFAEGRPSLEDCGACPPPPPKKNFNFQVLRKVIAASSGITVGFFFFMSLKRSLLFNMYQELLHVLRQNISQFSLK